MVDQITKQDALDSVEYATDKLNVAFAADKPADLKAEQAILEATTALLQAIEEQKKADPNFQKELVGDAAYQAKQATLATLLSTDQAIYDKAMAAAAGDRDGKTFQRDAAKSGAWVGKTFLEIKDGIKNIFSTKKDATAPKDTPQETATNAGDDEIDPATGKSKKKGFFDDLNIGDLVGGLLGVGGGYMLGNLFGGGLIGQIVGVLLAIGGFFMGEKALGGTINGWLGHPSGTSHPGATEPQNQLAQQKRLSGPAQGATQLTQQEMLAMQETARNAAQGLVDVGIAPANDQLSYNNAPALPGQMPAGFSR